MLGSQEAIRQGQQKERREEHRARRCHLVVGCLTLSRRVRAIDGRQIVLKDNRLWIDTGSHVTDGHHPFTGYYLPFPDCKYEGVVSTITSVAPILNWIYIDKKTYQVKYGVRIDAEPNLTGPFDCTRQDRRLTFEGWEGFCAVEEEPDLWALYFDRDDNGLEGKKPPHARALEITLSRKEMKITTEELRRQQELQSNIQIVNRANQQPDAPAPPEDPKVQQEQVNENLKAPQASAGAAIPESISKETEPVLVSPSSENANHVPSSPTEAWGSGSIWSQQTESRAEPTLPVTPASSVDADDRVSENEGRAPEQETPRARKTYKSPYIEDSDDRKAEEATLGFSAPAIDLEQKVEEHASTHEPVPPPPPTQETVDEPKPTINVEKLYEHTSKEETPSTQETNELKSASDTLQERPTNIDKAAASATSEAEIKGQEITPPEQAEATHSEQHVPADESTVSAPAENEKLAGSAEPTMNEEPSREVPMASIETPDEKEMSSVEPLMPTLQHAQGDASSVSEKPLSPPRPAAAPTTADPAAAALGPTPSDGQQQDAATTDYMLAYMRQLRLQDVPNPTANPSPWTASDGPHRPLPSPYAPLHLQQQQQKQQDQRVPPEYAVDYDEWSQTAPTHLLSPSPTASPTGSKAPTTRSVSLTSTVPPHSSGPSATASRSSSLNISAPARTRSGQEGGDEDEEGKENEADASSAYETETKTSVPILAVGNARSCSPPPPPPPPPPPQPLSLSDPVAWDHNTTTTLDFLSQPYSLAHDQKQLVTDPAPTQKNDMVASSAAGNCEGVSASADVPAVEEEGNEADAADGEAKGKKRWSALRTRMKSLRKKSSRKMR